MAEVMPFVFMGLGGLALVRGLFRPTRAVARTGSVTHCAGPNAYGVCDPTAQLAVPAGDPIYATASALVVAVLDDSVQLRVNNEPVFVMYDGVKPEVHIGQYVGRGQRIATSSGAVSFGAWQLTPSAHGPVMSPMPPSAWLAARGMRLLATDTGQKWCEATRDVSVPASAVSSCGFKTPDPATFALLPVRIGMGT